MKALDLLATEENIYIQHLSMMQLVEMQMCFHLYHF